MPLYGSSNINMCFSDVISDINFLHDTTRPPQHSQHPHLIHLQSPFLALPMIIVCSPCSPWWHFRYLLGVGLVLLLHPFRYMATSWVTPSPVMSSLICWCHVLLGRPRRLAPGIARSITLTLSASRLWTCPNQRRRPLHISSSIGETFRSSSTPIVW